MANIFENRDAAVIYAQGVLEAFSRMSYPTGPLHVEDADRDDVESRLPLIEGQRWWMLSPLILQCWRFDFLFLQPEAWAYFLPAFLSQGALAGNEYDFVELMIYQLSPDKLPFQETTPEHIHRFFSPYQCGIIAEFIRNYVEYEYSDLTTESAQDQVKTYEFWRMLAEQK